MGWQEWMVVKQSTEEALADELRVREIQKCGNIQEVKDLCVMLMRQNSQQQKLLSQAVGRIIELDAIDAASADF